jgi:hypothetical protein
MRMFASGVAVGGAAGADKSATIITADDMTQRENRKATASEIKSSARCHRALR